jgi:Copper chaperone
MKKILVTLVCALFAISMTSAQEAKKKSNKTTTTFFVESMDCNNCVKKIEKNIAFEKGVTDLKCNLETRTVEVTYRSDKTTEKKLIAAFDKIDKKAVVLNDGEKPKVKHDGHKH